jgi:hypothetical protein
VPSKAWDDGSEGVATALGQQPWTRLRKDLFGAAGRAARDLPFASLTQCLTGGLSHPRFRSTFGKAFALCQQAGRIEEGSVRGRLSMPAADLPGARSRGPRAPARAGLEPTTTRLKACSQIAVLLHG